MELRVGRGWKPLCEELGQALARLDPPGELLDAGIDASGLPRFRVRLDPGVRTEGRRLVREYENRALALCEACGEAGVVRSGAVVTVRCEHCV